MTKDQNEKPLPDLRRGFSVHCDERLLISPTAVHLPARERELAPVLAAVRAGKRLLWRHRAQPSATLDKKPYSVVNAHLRHPRVPVNSNPAAPRRVEAADRAGYVGCLTTRTIVGFARKAITSHPIID